MGNCGSISKDEDERKQSFTNLNMDMIKDGFWREKVCNYHYDLFKI